MTVLNNAKAFGDSIKARARLEGTSCEIAFERWAVVLWQTCTGDREVLGRLIADTSSPVKDALNPNHLTLTHPEHQRTLCKPVMLQGL
jgi:hypothetical protein